MYHARSYMMKWADHTRSHVTLGISAFGRFDIILAGHQARLAGLQVLKSIEAVEARLIDLAREHGATLVALNNAN